MKKQHYLTIKRLADLFFAAVILLCGLPLLLITSILVFKYLGRPILFAQRRIGLSGHEFTLYKFRSMSAFSEKPDSERLTRFGLLLRASSLDELPQLFNVIKGDMSLIGPRPLLPEYVPLYSEFQMRRHELRPGITGWAQINGRNDLSWGKKFEFDVFYVDNVSLSLDLKIFIKTILKVLSTSGVSSQGQVTASKFTGNETDG